MIHLYAITGEPVTVDLDGIDGAPVDAVSVGTLTALVSRHDSPPAAEEEAVLRHAAVADRVLAWGVAVLPARFAGEFASEAELTDAVERSTESLLQGLAEVAGCVELGVRARTRPPRVTELRRPAPGVYLRDRLEETRREEIAARRIHDALAPLARRSTSPVLPGRSGELVAAYLVPSADVEAFRSRFAEVAAANEGVSMICTGPWPPYSFGPAAA